MSLFGMRNSRDKQGEFPRKTQHELALEGLSMAIDHRVEQLGKTARVLAKIRNHYRRKASRYLHVLHEQQNGGVPLWKRLLGRGVSRNPRHLRGIGEKYRATGAPSRIQANEHVMRIEEFLLLLDDEVVRTEQDGWDTLSEEYRIKMSALLTEYASQSAGASHAASSPREPYWHIRAAWAEVCGALSKVLADPATERIQGQIHSMRQALVQCY